MKLFFSLRVWKKLFLRRFLLVDSFCKQCGVNVRDFHAPDNIWKQIEPYIKHGDVLCYQCFCDVLNEHGIYVGFTLVVSGGAIKPKNEYQFHAFDGSKEFMPIGNMGKGEPGSYKNARGCLAGLGDEPAEDMIRRYRDGCG